MNYSEYSDSLHIMALVKKYEESVSQNRRPYFDSDEIERLIEYYIVTIEAPNEEILKIVNLGLSFHPDNISLLIKKAELIIEMGKADQLNSMLNDIPELSAFYPYMNALVRANSGNIKESSAFLIENYKKIDKEDWVYLCMAYCKILYDKGAFKEELSFLNKVSKKNINEAPEILNELANCLEALNMYKECIEILDLLLDTDPYSIDTWIRLSQMYFFDGNMPKTKKALGFALAIEPENDLALTLLGGCYFNQKEYDKAIEVFHKLAQYSTNHESTYLFLGNIYAEQRKHEEALSCYRKAHIDNPHNTDVLTSMAMCLTEMGNLSEAMDFIDQSLLLNPYSVDSVILKSDIYLKEEKYKEAIRLLYSTLRDQENSDSKEILQLFISKVHLLSGDYKRASMYVWKAFKTSSMERGFSTLKDLYDDDLPNYIRILELIYGRLANTIHHIPIDRFLQFHQFPENMFYSKEEVTESLVKLYDKLQNLNQLK